MCNLASARKSIIPALASAVLLVCGCEYARSGNPHGVTDDTAVVGPSADRMEAIVFDARRAPSDSALRAIQNLGASHIALVSFGFQERVDDPNIHFSPDVRWYSESEDGARTLADRAAELGMGIVLKPQIWLRGGAWSADIDFDSEDAWKTWEANYRSYLMYCARLAADIDADMLIIGTELSNPVQERPAFWRNLIKEIRSVYRGRLTYGANWHEDYLEVPFWDALDAIGVQAYFPLSTAQQPSLDDAMDGWDEHVQVLRSLSAKENLPIIFTEVGYRSVSYAAAEPWRWQTRDEQVAPDNEIQAVLYQAFFESLWDRPWFGGAIIWKLYPDGSRRSRGRELDFTPQGKPAEDVLRAWFRQSD